jgi:hypothetical protein
MPRLVWSRLEDRSYEIGVDHGVLYVPDADDVFKGVVWNGLTRVTKESTRETEATYFDGMKIHNYIKQTEFKGTLEAITYPTEFERVEGLYDLKCGVSLGEQPPGLFGLVYRSLVADATGTRSGYKLHILYNLQATPDSKEYGTMNDSPELMEFSWTLESMPELVPNHRPTAEITLDSRRVDPLLLVQLEEILFGTDETDAYLPTMQWMVAFIDEWLHLRITLDDDPDSPTYGVFTVEERIPGTYIFPGEEEGTWELRGVDAAFDGDSYDLFEILCLPPTSGALIRIDDLGDGRWSATTDHEGLIEVDTDPESPTFGEFLIRNATLTWETDNLYRITDTMHD